MGDNPAKTNELFIATTLLIVLASAWGTEYFGLSMALGAFVAGILVAETEFRLLAEESIYPFKGLLLGLFFMSVGMTIDVFFIYQNLLLIFFSAISLIIIKAIIITGLCMLFGFGKTVSINAGLLMSQGSEFAFILFRLAIENNIINYDLGRILLITVTCSMALTPLLVMIGKKISAFIDKDNTNTPVGNIKLAAEDLTQHIVIAGFNATGKMIEKVLTEAEQNYISIEINEQLYLKAKDQGYAITYGDITRIDTINAIGLSRAAAIIITIDNMALLQIER